MVVKESNIIKINLDDYLVDFVMSLQGSTKQPVRISNKNFIGASIYRLLDKVPENCRFEYPILPNKRILEVEVGWLGSRGQKRKRPFTHYYFPVSKQRELELSIRNMFDELYFQVIEISREYTDAQYVVLIEKFCDRYKIDFAKNFESFKKKHYRARQNLLN